MQVILNLKDWKVKDGNVCGSYDLVLPNGKIAGKEKFNDYEGSKFIFSNELLKDIQNLEEKIKKEIEGILT